MTSRLTAIALVVGMLIAIVLGASVYIKIRGETDDDGVFEALKEVAPDGGVGVKQYHYPSGVVKEEVHWSRYRIIKIIYYSKMGEPIFVCTPDQKRTLQIALDDNGNVSEIAQSVNFAKDGYCFVLDDGVLRKVQLFRDGGAVSEIVFSSNGQK